MDRIGDGADRRRHRPPLTHEQLATLLGVGRSYASRVIQTFKAEGVLETRRGSILVRNPDGLRLRACQCNESVKVFRGSAAWGLSQRRHPRKLIAKLITASFWARKSANQIANNTLFFGDF